MYCGSGRNYTVWKIGMKSEDWNRVEEEARNKKRYVYGDWRETKERKKERKET